MTTDPREFEHPIDGSDMGEIIDRHTIEEADDMTGTITCACGEVGGIEEHPWHVAGVLRAEGYGLLPDDSTLSRVEIITDSYRRFTKYTPAGTVATARQDDGRTLKIFIAKGAS